MAKDESGAMEALAKNLKRQLRTETNIRFLKRMPVFAVDHSTPQEMLDLLGELEQAEAGQRRDSRH
jgi:hypothetical protein